ncbi:MAG: non-ribosomal peptide synthetase, partial [bacterium]|nr:non-ribosomal peptide synthetase [bacterium]
PGNTAFNVAGAVRLAGVPVPAALAAALEAVIRRHETLRTTFAEVAGRPVPKIHPPPAPELPLLDLTALPESAREQELRRRLDEESRTPFDLSAGPLVRVRLLRLAPAEHVLVLNLHHIIADGWSVGILIRELAAFYRAAIRRRPAPLAPLPLQYAEFAHWQRRWLEGEVLEAQLDYWRDQLGGSLPVLELPGDRPRPATQSFSGGQLSRRISPQLTGALRALGRSSGATLFMTLLAAFEVLLHRLSGGDDLLVGTPVAGRRWAETEGVIGCFLNTLVLRTDLAGDPTFDEL